MSLNLGHNKRSIDPYPISSLPKMWRPTIQFVGCGRAKDARIEWIENGYAGKGWYAYCGEYPEEGAVFLSQKTPKNVKVYQP